MGKGNPDLLTESKNDVGTEKGFFAKSTKKEFKQMCTLEILGLSEKVGNDGHFHENFKTNIERMDDGGYQARSPWKPDH